MNSVFQRTSHFFIVFLLFCMPSYSTANVQQSIQTLAKSLKNLAMLLSSKEQTKKQESDGKEIVLFRPQPQPLQRSPLELAKINLEEYSIAQSIDEINEKKINEINQELDDTLEKLKELYYTEENNEEELENNNNSDYFTKTIKPLFDQLIKEHEKIEANINETIKKLNSINKQLLGENFNLYDVKNHIATLFYKNIYCLESMYYYYYFYNSDDYKTYSNHIIPLISAKINILEQLFDKKEESKIFVFELVKENLRNITDYSIDYLPKNKIEIIDLFKKLEKVCNSYDYTITFNFKDFIDPYALLGLSKDSDNNEIKKNYKKLIQLWHPDKYVDPKQKQQAVAFSQKINSWYETIQDIKNNEGKDEWLYTNIQYSRPENKDESSDQKAITYAYEIIPLKPALKEDIN